MGVRPQVAVIGAGVGGIACAYRLNRAGFQTTVFEKSNAVGGRTRTVWRNGFGFDTGAGALPSTSREVRSLLQSLNVEDEIEKRGATIGVYRQGSIERIRRRQPRSLLRFGALSTSSKVSLWRFGVDLARMYRAINPIDLSTAAPFDTQTVRDYAESRFSGEVFDYLLAPLTRALFLVEPERTSVVDLFAAAKALLVGNSLWTHRDGVAFFAERAARGLNVHLETEVDGVVEDDQGVQVSWRAGGSEHRRCFDAAVLAIPAPDVVRIHSALDCDRRTYLEALDYSSSIVVNVGVGRAPAEESSMVLVPRSAQPDLPVVALGHNLAPGRVPRNAGILTAFWTSEWSRRHWGDDDASIVAATRQAVNDLFPGWCEDVRESCVSRWSQALVASRPGTYADLRAFAERSRRDRRIQLAGDYHAQTSINASVGAGQRAAGELVRILRKEH
ncbi:protoporphyrinogen/coproporphyrinogen oxidase [Mycolicibacterium sp. XJ879]